MIVFRKRLLVWIVKAYIKKWRSRMFFFFILGLIFFFLLLGMSKFIIPRIPIGQKETIGMVGSYNLNTLPPSILHEISHGLTYVSSDWSITPSVSKDWKIEDNGKTYVFNLRSDIKFSDGKNINSRDINYNFSDAKVERPNKNTIVFKLKESFSPFLVTVSRPVFKKGFVGVGNYKITDVKLNGNFVESITLVSAKDRYNTKTYQFYPSVDALKLSFLMGEISKAEGLQDVNYKNVSFKDFPNVNIKKNINYSQLVTIFYNTKDPVLSDKKIRNGLAYAVPDKFSYGVRNNNPYPPFSWAYSEQYMREQDLTHAKLLLDAANSATQSSFLNLQIKTLTKYKNTANDIIKLWEKIGIKSKIEIVDSVPSNFQVFIGDFYLPMDPDQYMLWHSNQDNNITNYENKRIDKLLEDGRKTTDVDTRKKIYSDFQKYLLDDSPATFLYFPYEYEISRK